MNDNFMNKIVSLCKRRGFIYPGSDIYGGLAGTWDYGPLGVELKNNIKNAWWEKFVRRRDDMFGIDSAILMNPKIWTASGHVDEFVDPMIDCKSCKSRFRADHLAEGKYGEIKTIAGKPVCPVCGKTEMTEARMFNMMFKTYIGPIEETSHLVYLRPENAQGIFVNFKNVLDTARQKLPFGIAQVGRVFRNEITPGDFTFRTREFELMEFEYFVGPDEWQKYFEMWLKEISDWLDFLGLDKKKINYDEIPKEERAHYSERTIDVEYQFPFGTKELCAIAYRTDYDLKRHTEFSGKDLTYFDEESGKRFIPHVIEPTFGLDRAFLAVIAEAYKEEEIKKGETRVVLKLPKQLAPINAAVFPLLANKPELVKKAREIYELLKATSDKRQATSNLVVVWDDRGNIGKRYYSQDEIGTPYCITVDFQTLEDDTVTVRERDTMEQVRIKIENLPQSLYKKF